MNTMIRKFCAEGTATAPRLHTDKLFQLPGGSVQFEGYLKDAICFIRDWQLLDENLWKLFVNQYRSNVDDADSGWRCEYWGKMMRGGCFTYAVTQDAALYDALTATVRDLLTTQQPCGRFSTYSKEAEYHGWDIWGRKYILLGLQYYMEICKDEVLKEEIIRAMMRHADAMLACIGRAEDGKLEINKATSHWGGLNSSSILEPFVRLYNITGEIRYLEFADYIVSRGGCELGNVFELAYEGRLFPYQYPVTKAYEMMSCFEGLLEYYRVTGIEKWRVAVENFARLSAQSDITLIGCTGCTHELYDHSAVRQLDVNEKGIIQETCVTVTWMKLCYQLLCETGDSFFADNMEKSIYNALLGAVNTNKCVTNYGLPFDSYSPILPGVRGRRTGGLKKMEDDKYYGCCAAIGAAGLGLAGMFAGMLSRDGIAVNMYLNGSIAACTPNDQSVTLRVDTAYPADGRVSIKLSLDAPEAFAIALRIPAWSANTTVAVNGEAQTRVVAGNYYRMNREWKQDDEIVLTLDMSVREILPEAYGVSSKDAPFAAFCRGPLVLARDARLGGDVDEAIAPAVENGCVSAKVVEENRMKTQIVCELPLRDGSTVRVIDYASAGKTWDEQSRMAAWIPMA